MIFIYIILFFIFLYLFLYFVGRKYENPYKLIMIFGKKGSGKTTFFTKMALKYINKGYTVYSNSYIYGTRLFNVSDFGHYGFPEYSVVFIDEVKTIWDSRDFKNFDKLVRDQFIYQRHDKLIIYLASQQFNIDKTIRDLCDELYLLKNYFNIFSVAKKINKKTMLHKSEDDNTENFITEDYNYDLPFSWHCAFIPRYIYYFDSFEKKEKEPIKYKITYRNDPFLWHISKGKNYIKYKLAMLLYRVQKYTNVFDLFSKKVKIMFISNRELESSIKYNFNFEQN